ncbi:hypothetical protein MCHI_000284 [Candidatus Magnetoovum chiemensis]|nr:hypothetical protein MCHI_000284 [Candidatus Magnetoovum chiemensis]
MNNNITESVKTLIESDDMKETLHSQTIKEFEEALERFETLLKKGLTKKRGHTLLTITDAHLYCKPFNNKV